MDVHEWIELGVKNKFCSKPICNTHEGPPMSEEELNEFDEGFDPCIHVIRVYSDTEQHQKVEDHQNVV